MANVTLGFKAFDFHELLCHFVAQESGLYRQQGLQVALLDTTFTPDEQLPSLFFSAACGAALVGWLNGALQRVVFVNTDRPLFWLYGRKGITDLTQLQGKRIATYPGVAPPSHFLSAILVRMGIDPRSDVELIAARDDGARLGLLKAGDVDAAVISAAMPPAVMAREGLQSLLFFGDEIRVPTTGLAVHSRLLEQHPELVGAMTAAHQQSLHLIRDQAPVVRKVLGQYFNIPSCALAATEELVGHCFCGNGRSSVEVIDGAVELMQDQLQCKAAEPAGQLYDFSFQR